MDEPGNACGGAVIFGWNIQEPGFDHAVSWTASLVEPIERIESGQPEEDRLFLGTGQIDQCFQGRIKILGLAKLSERLSGYNARVRPPAFLGRTRRLDNFT